MQLRLELWFLWQHIAPKGLQSGKRCHHVFSIVYDHILFILAGNDDIHKCLDEFEIGPDSTSDC